MNSSPDFEQTNNQNDLAVLATAAAHELNQPIGIIRAAVSGALNDLDEGLFEPEHDTRALLERIMAQSDRLQAIIDHFRQFARGDRSQREWVTLNVMVERTLINFAAQFRHHNIQLHVQPYEGDGEAIAWANLYLLEEVLLNLLLNAKDAVEEQANAQVWIDVWRDDNKHCVGFSVTDNGLGVSADQREKIFTPYFSTKSTEKGAGLGLYICQKIVYEFNGQLTYQDNESGGASFSVTLPITKEQPVNGTAV